MKKILFLLLTVFTAITAEARQWTLQECLDYALSHNISIRQTSLTRQSANEDLLQSQSALLPTLSASTSQNGTFRPWPATNAVTVSNSTVQSGADKFYYNGMYAVNGNWTVWNGNQNRNQVKLNELTLRQAELDSAITANSIQEQIAQLYVQILYSADAIEVNKAALETSKKNEERGQTFVEVGKMSRADLSQLTAQRAQDEYSIVEAESNLLNYKRQLKQLLQLTDDEEFDVVIPTTTDEMALQVIPTLRSVYEQALTTRPEIKNAEIGIETSELDIAIAKAGKLPTIGLNASAMTSNSSLSDNGLGKQLKNNFDIGAGVSVSIPLFDNRQTKTAVNKAKIARENYLLQLENEKTTLYSTIENYWLQAVTNQNKFKAAKTATESQETSYELLSEQFRLGLKNIVELMTGRDNLLSAQQNELQSKYLAILNIEMLKFYRDGSLK